MNCFFGVQGEIKIESSSWRRKKKKKKQRKKKEREDEKSRLLERRSISIELNAWPVADFLSLEFFKTRSKVTPKGNSYHSPLDSNRWHISKDIATYITKIDFFRSFIFFFFFFFIYIYYMNERREMLSRYAWTNKSNKITTGSSAIARHLTTRFRSSTKG